MCTVGVITVAYRAADAGPIETSIDEMVGLGPAKVIVVHDKKGSGGQHAKLAVDNRRESAAAKGVPLSLHEVDETETTLRWRWGIQKALEDPEVDAIFVFPGDFGKEWSLSGEDAKRNNRRGWREMMGLAQTNRIVVGDFQSTPGSFKEGFDAEVGLPTLEAIFPPEARLLRSRGLRKLRSEFFILGRAVFEQFLARQLAWTMDLTVDFLLTAVGSAELECKIVNIGSFRDDDAGRRNPMGQMMQMFRFVMQLALQRIRLERSRPDQNRLATYDELRDRISRAFERYALAVDRNRRALLPSREPGSGPEPLGANVFNSNQKVKLFYSWENFRGFSYIFDPREEDLSVHTGEGMARICNRRGSNPLYDGLDWLLCGSWGQMLERQYLLCRLPFESFHVTVKDGFNDENLKQLHAEAEEELQRLFDGFPGSFSVEQTKLPQAAFPTFCESHEPLRFKFQELRLWGQSVLVARLKAADESSRGALRKVEANRAELTRQWAAECGLPLPDKPEKYVPHISLGYFPNPGFAALAEPLVPGWSQSIGRELGGACAEFRSASLYAFTSMACFLKPAAPTPMGEIGG